MELWSCLILDCMMGNLEHNENMSESALVVFCREIAKAKML